MEGKKRNQFNSYVKSVAVAFDVSEDDIFSDSREKDVIDARHMIMYLCKARPMPMKFIHSMFDERGLVMDYTSVMYGCKSGEKKAKKDVDFSETVQQIMA